MTQMTNHDEVVRIRISQLSRGAHEYHFLPDPGELGLEANFQEKVQVDVDLEKTSNHLYLKAAIQTTGMFQCDRCVEEFEKKLNTSYTMLYVYDAIDAAKYEESQVQVLSPDATYIDLTQDVREVVMLAVPMKLLCRENCRGLCPRCGTNWNYGKCTCHEEQSDFTLGSLLNREI
jgi:uncharacterized protein